jgi:alanyl-tRNA synthetase
MTERLYLQDPYLRSFTARALQVRDLDGRPAAILDRSAFYPEGGGQPGDRGTLGEVKVLDTQERGGEVLHVLEKPIEPGAVTAEIDWSRRFDHMQQHHGQHLLSAAFEKLSAPTLSFHLGERLCTVDLDAPLGRLDLERAEALANESVWRDLPVVARDFTGEERAKLPLRKEPVKGDRVVLVEGVDASPCGGTHPGRTGEVGCIAVLRAQKWGEGKSRVEFVCGARVVRLLHETSETVAAAAEALKTAPADVAQAASRVVAESQARRKAADALLEDLAALEAARLKGQGSPVVAKLERGAAFARAVAQSLAQGGATALLGTVEDGRAHLVFARPKGAPGPAMGELLKEALAALGGKGGGGPDFAQGSGAPANLDDALSRAAHKLAHH